MGSNAALSSDGRWLAVLHGSKIWVDELTPGTVPARVVALPDAGVAVRIRGETVWAVTAGGMLVEAALDGTVRRQTELLADGRDLAAAGEHLVALTERGYQRVLDGVPADLVEIGEGAGVAVAPDGVVVVGTRTGRLVRFDPSDAPGRGLTLAKGAPVTGLAVLPASIAAVCGDGLYVASPDGAKVVKSIGLGDVDVQGLAASADGRWFATVFDRRSANVIELTKAAVVAQVVYVDREVTGVAFGGTKLGVGLDQGDGNWLDMTTGMLTRNDPPHGEPHRSWLVSVQQSAERDQAGVTGAAGPAVDPRFADEARRCRCGGWARVTASEDQRVHGVRAGSDRTFTCPSCGRSFQITSPFMAFSGCVTGALMVPLGLLMSIPLLVGDVSWGSVCCAMGPLLFGLFGVAVFADAILKRLSHPLRRASGSPTADPPPPPAPEQELPSDPLDDEEYARLLAQLDDGRLSPEELRKLAGAGEARQDTVAAVQLSIVFDLAGTEELALATPPEERQRLVEAIGRWKDNDGVWHVLFRLAEAWPDHLERIERVLEGWSDRARPMPRRWAAAIAAGQPAPYHRLVRNLHLEPDQAEWFLRAGESLGELRMLGAVGLDGETMRQIVDLPWLDELTFLGTDTVAPLLDTDGLPALEELTVLGPVRVGEIADLMVAPTLPALRTMTIVSPVSGGGTVRQPSVILKAGRPMHGVEGPVHELARLARSLESRELRRAPFHLQLLGWELDAGALSAFVDQPAVQRLSGLTLLHAGLTASAARVLAGAPLQVEQLDLHGGPIGPEGGQALAGAAWWSRLTRVTLAHMDLDDAAGAALIAALDASRVEAVDLGGNKLGPKTVAALAARPWPRLSHLDLSMTPIEAEGRAAAGQQ